MGVGYGGNWGGLGSDMKLWTSEYLDINKLKKLKGKERGF